jgi:predicted dehydrogenase
VAVAIEGKHPERISEMSALEAGRKVGVGFIGTGAVTAYHHLPGLRLDPRVKLVAICDTDPEILKKRQAEWGVAHASTDPEVICGLEET